MGWAHLHLEDTLHVTRDGTELLSGADMELMLLEGCGLARERDRTLLCDGAVVAGVARRGTRFDMRDVST